MSAGDELTREISNWLRRNLSAIALGTPDTRKNLQGIQGKAREWLDRLEREGLIKHVDAVLVLRPGTGECLLVDAEKVDGYRMRGFVTADEVRP